MVNDIIPNLYLTGLFCSVGEALRLCNIFERTDATSLNVEQRLFSNISGLKTHRRTDCYGFTNYYEC